MQKYEDYVLDPNGNVMEGVSVTIADQDGTTTIYSDDGVTPIDPAVVQTDELGKFWFYGPNGRYDLSLQGGGIVPDTRDDIILYDDADDATSPSIFPDPLVALNRLRVNSGGTAYEFADVDASEVVFTPTGGNATDAGSRLDLRPHQADFDAAPDQSYYDACIAIKSANHYPNQGANIERIPDRLFVGDAIYSDGQYTTPVTGLNDWYSDYAISTGAYTSSPVILSTMAVCTLEGAPASANAGLFAAQSLSGTSSTFNAIGVIGIGVNNCPATHTTRAMGGYFEGHKVFDTSGTGTRGITVDIIVETGSTEQQGYPYQQTTTSAINLGAGGEHTISAHSVNPGSAININNNNTAFRRGIVFGSDSIEGWDGSTVTDIASAIVMSYNHSINWYNSTNGTVGTLACTNDNATVHCEMRFTDTGISYFTDSDTIFKLIYTASAENHFTMTPGASGVSPILSAAGSIDTDVDIRLIPKGAGVTRTSILSITDGVTAPAAVVGQARIYVNSSNGDLEVIFGDGTTKTIVVDT